MAHIKETNEQKLENVRHSLAHLLAATVRELWPGAQNAIGPTVENGFYQDFGGLNKPVSEADLPVIEEKMREILKTWGKFERRDVSVEEARKEFAWNPYKLELIEEFAKEGKGLTFYISGKLIDLCKGGHVENASEINPDAFKLIRVAGAYWRGSEKNEMLTRIYGVAFETKEELKSYLAMLEEAAKRDHRKLGQELDLFTFSEKVGSGLPLFTPKGTLIRTQLQNALLEISKKYEMLPVTTPHIAKRELYETSGHAEKFGDELFTVVSHYNQEFVMKPVNCPHHIQIYASRPRSYRDLPLRYMESTMQYRDEKPGEISGLTRVRSITVDDGHIFCRVDQIEQEAKNIANIIEEFYKGLGMWGNHWVSLSVRDPQHPEKYIGETADWEQAETMLEAVSDELGLRAKRMEGEAALYGPKLDYMFKDSLGHERQLATIQIDFAMPKRFDISYIDTKGEEKSPVIIHRAILGSYERFLAILIEHFAGAFPLWLAPVQAKILPVSEKFESFAQEILQKLKSADVRTELSATNETLGKRIREAEMQKTPYILVVGEKEKANKTVSVRHYHRGQEGETTLENLIKKLNEEIGQKSTS